MKNGHANGTKNKSVLNIWILGDIIMILIKLIKKINQQMLMFCSDLFLIFELNSIV